MTEEEFAQKWMITSSTGRVYTRRMLLSSVCRSVHLRSSDVPRAFASKALNDKDFMEFRRGMTPSAIARDIEQRWLERSANVEEV